MKKNPVPEFSLTNIDGKATMPVEALYKVVEGKIPGVTVTLTTQGTEYVAVGIDWRSNIVKLEKA